AVAVHGLAAIAAVAVIAVSLLPVPSGRAGMPEAVWNDRLDFVETLAPATGPGRVLVAGLPDSMPGESRVGNGY
ncbi:MAG: hypothetical protein GWN85_20465, partial [Gemmatimonadetes bacterium]|nr:hypothetical protein [Gemmatimonadota bacterium]NIR38027.1 hypothetical protein [Actinomycetota bacterium]NIS32591.1 hypothetical protein [Actinomycetota bacterium]NIT96343.1 hypothetical protein [Actinomycetota bacterium]NIU67601.1 hypothetical protein [Actinomycetota bacterium]